MPKFGPAIVLQPVAEASASKPRAPIRAEMAFSTSVSPRLLWIGGVVALLIVLSCDELADFSGWEEKSESPHAGRPGGGLSRWISNRSVTDR